MGHTHLYKFGAILPFGIGPKLCSRFLLRPQLLKHAQAPPRWGGPQSKLAISNGGQGVAEVITLQGGERLTPRWQHVGKLMRRHAS